MESYLVNILNENMIPWINKKGPLIGIRLTPGIYSLLKKDPRVFMERTTPEAVQKYMDEKRKEELKNTAIEEKLVVVDNEEKISIESEVIVDDNSVEEVTVENEKLEAEELNEEEIDNEIDSILENVDFESQIEKAINLTDADDAIETNDVSEVQVIKEYSDDELSTLTKAQMKKILAERGYTSGPYAGKYHDTVEDLIRKVKSTQ